MGPALRRIAEFIPMTIISICAGCGLLVFLWPLFGKPCQAKFICQWFQCDFAAKSLICENPQKSICYNGVTRWGNHRATLFDNVEMKMTKQQAKKLAIGDYVTWQEEMQFHTPQAIAAATGEVIEKGYNAFKVRWGDGLTVAYKNEFADNIHLIK